MQSKILKYTLGLFLYFPALLHCIPENSRYHKNIKVHRQQFFDWLAASPHRPDFPYPRVKLTVSCQDCDYIPKCQGAGQIFYDGSEPYQLMHNGLKVLKDCYCGTWMTDLIYGLQGHHEPQEEKIFHEILKYIPANATMIELGSYWAYYSLWFAKQIPHATNYLIEPDLGRLETGRKNFALNGAHGHFFRGYVVMNNTDCGDFNGASQILIDSFLDANSINHVNILHSDIQGAEYEMLKSAARSIHSNKIDYFFVSTHSSQIHSNCIDLLQSYGYIILAEHSPDQSYSVDGLVVAKRKGVRGPKKIDISKYTP